MLRNDSAAFNSWWKGAKIGAEVSGRRGVDTADAQDRTLSSRSGAGGVGVPDGSLPCPREKTVL